MKTKKNRPKAVSAMTDFSQMCNAESSWAKYQLKNKMKIEVDRCQKSLKKTSLLHGNKWLRLWKKNTGYPVFANSLEKAYEIYLQDNLITKKDLRVRYTYSEHLFSRKKYVKASEQFEKLSEFNAIHLAKVKSKSKKGVKVKGLISNKMLHDARYAALISLQKSLTKGGKENWSEETQKRFKSLSKTYLSHHKKGKHVLDVKFKLALMDFEANDTASAQKLFYSIGEEFAKTKKGIQAQDYYLEILNKDKSYADIKKYIKHLKKTKKVSKRRKTKLGNIYEESYFLQVQNMESKGELKLAVKEYRKFAIENKKSKLAPKAYINSVNLLYTLNDLSNAAEESVRYFEIFKNEDNKVKYLIKAAKTYENLGLVGKAANLFKRLSTVKGENVLKWKKIAADLYYISNKTNKAKAIYKTIIKFPKSKFYISALKKLELIEKDNANYNKEEHYKYIKILSRTGVQPFSSNAKVTLVEEIYNNKNYPKAFTSASKILKTKKASQMAKSKARYIQAQILEKEFLSQSMKSKADRLALVISLKTAKLEKAQKAYQSVMRYGDPEYSIKALARLGELYVSFVKSIKEMPLPKGLTKADEPSFREEMGNLTLPMEDRSIEAYTSALEQAQKLEIRTGIISKIKIRLTELNFSKNEKSLVQLGEPSIVIPVIKKEVKI